MNIKAETLNRPFPTLRLSEIAIKFNWKVKVAQLCPTLCNPMIYSVQGILEARILEWVAFSFSRGSSQPRHRMKFYSHCRQILYQLSHKGSPKILEWVAYPFASGSSRPRNRTRVSCIAGEFFTNWDIRKAPSLTEMGSLVGCALVGCELGCCWLPGILCVWISYFLFLKTSPLPWLPKDMLQILNCGRGFLH